MLWGRESKEWALDTEAKQITKYVNGDLPENSVKEMTLGTGESLDMAKPKKVNKGKLAAEIGLGFVPGISEGMDAAYLISGLITGDLTTAAMSALGLILPGISGSSLMRLIKKSEKGVGAVTKAEQLDALAKMKQVGPAKLAISQFGEDGAEKLGKVLSEGVNPKAERKIAKAFGVDQKDLKIAGKQMVADFKKTFKEIHGYDKDEIIKEMDKLYQNRETERKVYDRAINDNITKSTKTPVITENEKYLDIWYKLQNGEMEWPNFIEGKPNARQVVEATIQDAEHGKGNYIAAFKGMGNYEGRQTITAHSTTGADFGDMVYSSTRRTTGANYAYDDFGFEKTLLKKRISHC